MFDTTTQDDSDPFDANVDAELSERSLVYALSAITTRTLLDLREDIAALRHGQAAERGDGSHA